MVRENLTGAEKIKKWRRNTKKRMIESMGGKCCVCGYDKCDSALAFHHLDPNEKDFSFGATRANPTNWKTIVAELRKCILVCHNCHSEIHEGITEIPKSPPKFDERYVNYIEANRKSKMVECPVCATLMSPHQKTCSYKCSAKISQRVDWSSINLEAELKTKSYVQIANELGVSDASVHKRAKKLGLK